MDIPTAMTVGWRLTLCEWRYKFVVQYIRKYQLYYSDKVQFCINTTRYHSLYPCIIFLKCYSTFYVKISFLCRNVCNVTSITIYFQTLKIRNRNWIDLNLMRVLVMADNTKERTVHCEVGSTRSTLYKRYSMDSVSTCPDLKRFMYLLLDSVDHFVPLNYKFSTSNINAISF